MSEVDDYIASLVRDGLEYQAEIRTLREELSECKRLAIATLCDKEPGHDGPGGALERVIALAKECCELTSYNGELGARAAKLHTLEAEVNGARAYMARGFGYMAEKAEREGDLANLISVDREGLREWWGRMYRDDAELESERVECELKGKIAALEVSAVQSDAQIDDLNRSADRAQRRMATLEAAVCAVRNGDHRGVAMNFHTLDKLYALVPEVGA